MSISAAEMNGHDEIIMAEAADEENCNDDYEYEDEDVYENADDSTRIEQMTFLLSMFDNIVGPKLVHLWQFADTECLTMANLCPSSVLSLSQTINEQPIRPSAAGATAESGEKKMGKKKRRSSNSLYKYPMDAQMLKYIAIKTLNGELYQEKLKNQFKYRLYLIKEIECAIFSIFFDAASSSLRSASSVGNNNNETSGDSLMHDSHHLHHQQHHQEFATATSLNCFSIVVPLKCKDLLLNQYGDTTSFLISSFENYLMDFKVLAHTNPKKSIAIERLTTSIKQFCTNIYTLKTRGLITNRFSPLVMTDKGASSARILIRDTFLNESNFSTTSSHSYNATLNNDFLVNAITSHLITNFNTIVIGKTSNSINRMISTLALFMPKEKLTISCFALEETSKLSPFFCLQGIVADNPENLDSIVDYNFLFQRDSPTTIVDLSYKMVFRTAILNEFESLRETFMKQKIRFLFNSVKLDDLMSMCPVADYIKWTSSEAYTTKSTLITRMLKQMDLIDSEFGVKDSFFDLLQKDLYLMALNLIEYVNNEYTPHLVSTQTKEKQTMKMSMRKIAKDLDIKTIEDLNVLIALCNYLKPGFSSNIEFTN